MPLSEAVEVFLNAYRKRYSNAFGHVRDTAPMKAEVVALAEAFRSEERAKAQQEGEGE